MPRFSLIASRDHDGHDPVTYLFDVLHRRRALLPAATMQSLAVAHVNGYPPDLQAEATKLVLEQAEALCADWAA